MIGRPRDFSPLTLVALPGGLHKRRSNEKLKTRNGDTSKLDIPIPARQKRCRTTRASSTSHHGPSYHDELSGYVQLGADQDLSAMMEFC